MTRELKWRIITLQIVLVVLLAGVSGLLFAAANFDHSTVQSELSAQQIVFPAADSASVKALPAADAAAMAQYAGQTLTTGDQAAVWANNFIAVHLKEIGQGKTYDYYSGKSMGEAKTNPTLSAADQNTALTLFRGEALRSMLLQAWGFWTMGTYAFYAAIAVAIAAVAVLGALIYELRVAPRREGVRQAAPGGLGVAAR
jgi:heme exporter protein D